MNNCKSFIINGNQYNAQKSFKKSSNLFLVNSIKCGAAKFSVLRNDLVLHVVYSDENRLKSKETAPSCEKVATSLYPSSCLLLESRVVSETALKQTKENQTKEINYHSKSLFFVYSQIGFTITKE